MNNQLHISGKSKRGVPKIVKEYGQEAFEFREYAIIVTIPFNRLDLGNDNQVASRWNKQNQLPALFGPVLSREG